VQKQTFGEVETKTVILMARTCLYQKLL